MVDGGEWIVKSTDYDQVPPRHNPDGTVTTTASVGACNYSCPAGGEDGMDVGVGKSTDPYNTGERTFCILKSHPQYGEFAHLRRCDRVRFEYRRTVARVSVRKVHS